MTTKAEREAMIQLAEDSRTRHEAPITYQQRMTHAIRTLGNEVDLYEAMKEGFEQRTHDIELRAATHGANQARREVKEYLRSINQHMLAMAIDERCKWPERSKT